MSYIVVEVCKAISFHLSKYLAVPSATEEWLAISERFFERWDYPNRIGAVDGKHIPMQPPPGSGSEYYSYKHTHSIVLMVVAGPDFECIYTDVGINGRVSDGGVWNVCTVAKTLEKNELSVPAPSCLPLGVKCVPYVFVGDDFFALKSHMMKPYPQSGLSDDKRTVNF